MRSLTFVLLLAGSAAAQPAQIQTLAVPDNPQGFVISKSGKVAAVVGKAKLYLWSLPEGRLTRTIDLGNRNIYITAASPDGSSLAAGDMTGGYTVWNTTSGAPRIDFRLPHYPAAMSFSPDGKRLAIAPANEPVLIYDSRSWKQLFELQRTIGGSQAVAFSPDGTRIATADSDTVVRVYDARNGELLSRYTDLLMEPLAAAFSADSKQVLSGGGDKFIAWLDASSGRPAQKSPKLEDPPAYLEVSPDGKFLAAGLMHADNMRQPGQLLIYDMATGRQVDRWTPNGLPVGGTWTPDGHLIVATAGEKEIQLWRVR